MRFADRRIAYHTDAERLYIMRDGISHIKLLTGSISFPGQSEMIYFVPKMIFAFGE